MRIRLEPAENWKHADKLLFCMVLGIRYQLHAELDAFMGVVLSLWNTNLNVEKIAYKVSVDIGFL